FFLPPAAHPATAYGDASMTGGREILVVDSSLPEDTVNQYACFTEGDHPLIRIDTDADGDRSVLIVKESYANAFIPFLLAHYKTVYAVDFRYFNREGQPAFKLDGFASEHGIDDILVINYFSVPNKQDLTEWLGYLID
ncbi:MAG: DHHW family protein, partial [Oscillospiraceae bacterium]|nr:DHHW family protein [Oscillospiraceae bacterium]